MNIWHFNFVILNVSFKNKFQYIQAIARTLFVHARFGIATWQISVCFKNFERNGRLLWYGIFLNFTLQISTLELIRTFVCFIPSWIFLLSFLSLPHTQPKDKFKVKKNSSKQTLHTCVESISQNFRR